MKKFWNGIVRHVVHAGGNLDHWLIASLIAFLISLGMTILVHSVEGHDARLDAMEQRVNNLDCKE